MNNINDYLNNIKPNQFIIYKEYFNNNIIIIKIIDKCGDEISKLIIRNYKDERFSLNNYYISSFTHFGIDEKICNNKNEYYINENLYSDKLDENEILINYIKIINQCVDENEELTDFIKSDKNIDIINDDILYNLEKNKLICDSCLCKIVPQENICYYCDRKLCDYCLDNSYRHFVKCYTCNTQWCYYDGLHADYKCEKIGSYSNCEDCGN
jgi:hypothetical protein